MDCTRFQTDGMRLLDNEMSQSEQADYEAHVSGCDTCRFELRSIGRIVEMTNEMRIRVPDDVFWDGYWDSVYRRSERSAGFVLVVVGVVALLLYGLIRAVLSPEFFTYEGISVAVIILGLIVIFISVARERFHERRNDPYKGVRR